MPKRNFAQVFKVTAAAGVLLTVSLATAPATLAGNAMGYVQEGFSALRALGSARRNDGNSNSNNPSPSYTPPAAPVYTPPPVAPVYTPPPQQQINVQIRPVAPSYNYAQPVRPAYHNTYRQPAPNYREQAIERERITRARVRPQVVVVHEQAPKQPTAPATPSPPEITNVPNDNKTVAPAPSLKSDGGKFETAWINSSMLRIMNKF